jgi:ParB/RepB/Spo0J family partition protein
MDVYVPEPEPESVPCVSTGREILARVQVAMSNATLIRVNAQLIRTMPGQPRAYFDPVRIQKLAASLNEVGQIMPGIIRRIDDDAEGHEYELLDGERRLRAIIMSNIPTYRALLIDVDDEAAPFVVSSIANFNRENHTLLETSDAVVRMHEGLRMTLSEIADVLGLSHIVEASNLYGLRRLIPEVRDLLDPNITKGYLLPKTAAIQISQAAPEDQMGLAEKMMNRELTVTGLREHVRTVAASRGRPLFARAISPDERRKSVQRRSDAIRRSVNDLNRILNEPDIPHALSGFTPHILREIQEALSAIQEMAAACEKIIQANTTSRDT